MGNLILLFMYVYAIRTHLLSDKYMYELKLCDKKVEKDILKKEFFKSVGITLFVVKEYKYTEEKEHADFYIHERTTFNDLTRLINDIIKSLDIDISVDVDCSRDAIAIKKMEEFINRYRDDLMVKFNKSFPDFSKSEVTLYMYVVLGFSARAISIFLNENIDVIYNRKSRLKQKIQKSKAFNKDLFLEPMS